MKIQIHHLPSGTKWVGNDYLFDDETMARTHAMLVDAVKVTGQTLNLETADGAKHFFSSNVLKDCVLSLV